MRRLGLLAAVGLGVAVSGAALAQGVLSGLESYGLKHGTITARAKAGGVFLKCAGGDEVMRVGPQTTYLRIERVQRDALRTGDRVVLKDVKDAAPVVILFDRETDLEAVIDTLGPAARRQAEAERKAVQ